MDIYYYQSPLGVLKIEAEEHVITGIRFVDSSPSNDKDAPNHPVIQEACYQLDEYFAGKREIFELPLSPQGTSFQQKVWKNLQEISYGETISYAQLAQAIDNPKAYRAVGSANGKNPIAIVIPCHRVIETNGKLGGYAYGVDIKKQLLEIEKSSLFW
jgi:methylated-DNA-[protein]-cysteine S-methyltransferase